MSDVDYMNECTIRDVLAMLVDKKGFSIEKAMDAFYHSHTFDNLNNPKTGLFYQSPVYIYDLLEQELEKTEIE